MIRPLSLPLLALALAACSASAPEHNYAGRVDRTPTGQITAGDGLSAPIASAPDESAKDAILFLPEDAGAPGRMSERQYANGWRQSVSLDGQQVAGGWNDLAVDIMTDEAGERRGANIPMGKPSQDGVRREILARFPGTPMRIVGRPMRNALGPFGLAIGVGAGGVRCAFAWQWVDDLRAVKGGRSFFGRELPASVRMRLCRKGVTADQLASWYEGLDLSGAAKIERVVEAAKNGTAGRVVEYSRDATTLGDVVDPSMSLEGSLAGRAPVSRAEPAAPGPAPRRQDASRRRRAAPRAEPESAPEPYEPPAQPSLAGGRNYLAPVAGGAPAPSYQTAPVTRGAGFGPARLDPGLPAQAYQGPASRGGSYLGR
jgi:hypothetical protein